MPTAANTNRRGAKKDGSFRLRLAPGERELLDKQAAARGVSRARYLVWLLEREELAARALEEHPAEPHRPAGAGEPQPAAVAVYRDADLSRIMWHLGHWGNNLNQATAAFNRIAMQPFLTDQKNAKVLADACDSLHSCEQAIGKIARIVEALLEERHVVTRD